VQSCPKCVIMSEHRIDTLMRLALANDPES
jgi:hypothetical protein